MREGVARARDLEQAAEDAAARAAASSRRQCGPESKIKLTVVKRDDRKLREALGAFSPRCQASSRSSSGKTGGDEGGARYYYGLAKLAEADKEFEAYLDLKFPQDLNFDPGPSTRRSRRSRTSGSRLGRAEDQGRRRRAKAKYNAVLAVKDAAELDRRGGPHRPDLAGLLRRAVHRRDPDRRADRPVRRRTRSTRTATS